MCETNLLSLLNSFAAISLAICHFNNEIGPRLVRCGIKSTIHISLDCRMQNTDEETCRLMAWSRSGMTALRFTIIMLAWIWIYLLIFASEKLYTTLIKNSQSDVRTYIVFFSRKYYFFTFGSNFCILDSWSIETRTDMRHICTYLSSHMCCIQCIQLFCTSFYCGIFQSYALRMQMISRVYSVVDWLSDI